MSEVPPPDEWRPGGVPMTKVREAADCHCTGLEHDLNCHRRAVIVLLEQRRNRGHHDG